MDARKAVTTYKKPFRVSDIRGFVKFNLKRYFQNSELRSVIREHYKLTYNGIPCYRL
jgi:hypothetical protein